MSIVYHESTKTFHLQNDTISYIMTVMPNGQMGQLYFGKKIRDREDFSHLFENQKRAMSSYVYEDERSFSMEHVKQEYGVYGSTDFRQPAIEVLQENGSRISEFQFVSYTIMQGKPKLEGLPATYTEKEDEAETLILHLEDPVDHLQLDLLYTIFAQGGILARSAKLTNKGEQNLRIDRAMSLCLDLPDREYDWIQFTGAWSRERTPGTRRLEHGITSVGSLRGHSSPHFNPFVILKRPNADERSGECMGFSLVYSGNFLAQAEVDPYDTTRVLMGIHPTSFQWKLEPQQSFQTPEAVVVYTDEGLNAMSQTFHRLYQKRLARGYWRDKTRPILCNNWEATYFDFNEEKLLTIASKAKECGVELFVLDDGWFGSRRNDFAGLGDWTPCTDLLPNGISGLADKIEEMGLKFGLWFEPEMVNPDSDLYRAHPDWILTVPERNRSLSRHQCVLDFSRAEVVDNIYEQMAKVLESAKISYIKWDMNRSITECFSAGYPADRQGEIFHRYILGVYSLYEKLTTRFPEILFESCSSGGARFDPGMLYYAPQAWTSDNTDAIERIHIQYGSSYCYPVSSFGAHVSAVPNHQMNRITPLSTRANVAYFGTFGYELDLNKLTDEEIAEVKEQTVFMKEYRHLFQFGTFYRLQSPFDHNEAAWMVVSEDKKEAVVGWYRILSKVNSSYMRIRLSGLDPDLEYAINGARSCYGDELMNLGLITSDGASGEPVGSTPEEYKNRDFGSRLYILKAK